MNNKKGILLVVLLLAVVGTAFSVSGTYAKYTTTDETGADSARVAQWSFGLTETPFTIDSLFEDSYTNVPMPNGHQIIKSMDGEDVVAPGANGKYTFSLTGTVETNYTLNFSVELENSVVLTKNGPFNIVDGYTANEYSPLEFTVYSGTVAPTMPVWAKLDSTNLTAALNKLVEKDGEDIVYGPTTAANSNLGTYTIEWRWDFEQNPNGAPGISNDIYDQLDTLLGNKIYEAIKAGKTEGDEGYPYVSLNVAITATQSNKKVTN